MNLSEGASYAGRYALKVLLFYILAMALVALILVRLDLGLGNATPSVSCWDAVKHSVRYVLPLVPVIFLAFAAGSFPEGSRQRLVLRIIMNAVLAAVIVLVAGDLSFTIEELVLDGETGMVSPEAAMYVDMPPVSALLLLVPLLSVIDSFLEYAQHSGR